MVEVKVKREPERRVYALKHVGPYSGIGGAFQRVMDHVAAKGQELRSVVGVFCDDPGRVAEDRLVSYACLEVEGEPLPEGDVEAKRLPEGLVATALVRGPYGGQEVQEAYTAIYERLEEGGKYEALDLSDHTPFETTCREFYPNDPEVTPPEDLVTEIQVPISVRRVTGGRG